MDTYKSCIYEDFIKYITNKQRKKETIKQYVYDYINKTFKTNVERINKRNKLSQDKPFLDEYIIQYYNNKNDKDLETLYLQITNNRDFIASQKMVSRNKTLNDKILWTNFNF